MERRHGSLYSTIALTNSTFEPFATQFNAALYSPLVKSLTLRVTALTSLPQDDLHHLLPPIITGLTKLTTFSFVAPDGDSSPGFSLSRRLLVSLVEALPQTCTDLEIDTGAYDIPKSWTEPDLHMCDTIRLVLPRMRNVRLCLHAMCSMMFGEGTLLGIPTSNAKLFKPISLLQMDNLMVNCVRRSISTLSCLCGREGESPIRKMDNHTTSAWHSSFAASSTDERNAQAIGTFVGFRKHPRK
jgi:hypothetical protein